MSSTSWKVGCASSRISGWVHWLVYRSSVASWPPESAFYWIFTKPSTVEVILEIKVIVCSTARSYATNHFFYQSLTARNRTDRRQRPIHLQYSTWSISHVTAFEVPHSGEGPLKMITTMNSAHDPTIEDQPLQFEEKALFLNLSFYASMSIKLKFVTTECCWFVCCPTVSLCTLTNNRSHCFES